MRQYLAFGVLILVIILLASRSCSTEQQAQTYLVESQHLHDSARTYRDERGRWAATNRQLQLTQAQLVSVQAGNDSLLRRLQQATDKHSTAAVAVSTSRTGSASGVTTRIIYRTVPGQPCDTIPAHQPTYEGTAVGDGFTAAVVATADTVRITSYTVQQELTVNFTSTGGGLFRKRQQVATVTATSPGGKVNDVRAFSVPPEPPRRGVWFIAGYVAGKLTPPYLSR